MEKYFVVLGFIIFDIVTGIIKALSNEGLNSTMLRKGLFHKLSEILSAAGAGLAEYGLQYIDIGISVPLAASVCAYICVMELVSIIENLCITNPNMGKFFKPFLNKLKVADEQKELEAAIIKMVESEEDDGKKMGD